MIIHAYSNPPGMNIAPMMPAITIRYFHSQNPFCIGPLMSLLDLTPIMMSDIRKKKMVTAKQTRYTKA